MCEKVVTVYNVIKPFLTSDAEGRRHLVLLPVPDEGATVDLAADALLHHVPSVELQAGVRGLHPQSHQVNSLLNYSLFKINEK